MYQILVYGRPRRSQYVSITCIYHLSEFAKKKKNTMKDLQVILPVFVVIFCVSVIINV